MKRQSTSASRMRWHEQQARRLEAERHRLYHADDSFLDWLPDGRAVLHFSRSATAGVPLAMVSDHRQ
jgi:hypothetical protein